MFWKKRKKEKQEAEKRFIEEYVVPTEGEVMGRWFAGKGMMLAIGLVVNDVRTRFDLKDSEVMMLARSAAVSTLTAELGLSEEHATAKVDRVLRTEDGSRPDAVIQFVSDGVPGQETPPKRGNGTATKQHLREAVELMTTYYLGGAFWVAFTAVIERAKTLHDVQKAYLWDVARYVALWMLVDEFGLPGESSTTVLDGTLLNKKSMVTGKNMATSMYFMRSTASLPIGYPTGLFDVQYQHHAQEDAEAVGSMHKYWIVGSMMVAIGLVRTSIVIQHGIGGDEARIAAHTAAIMVLMGEFGLSEESAKSKVEEVLNHENTAAAAAGMIVGAVALPSQAIPSVDDEAATRAPLAWATTQQFDEWVQGILSFWVAGSMVVVGAMTVERLRIKFGLSKREAVRIARSQTATTVQMEFGVPYEAAEAKIDAILDDEYTLLCARTVSKYAERLFELADPKLAKEVMGFTIHDEERECWVADEEVMRELKSLIDEISLETFGPER